MSTLNLVELATEHGMTRDELTCGVVMTGVMLYVASDPRVQAMADTNDAERFAEGCRAPWFVALVGQALAAIRETAEVAR